MKPICLDIETSGIDKFRCGIWQIGAYDLSTGQEFLQEARLSEEDAILNEPTAKKPVLEVIGKTEGELRDKRKQSQKTLLENFFRWFAKMPMKNFLCQNPQFDVGFLDSKARKYKLEIPFHYRSFDLHNIAQLRYHDLHGEFLIEDGKVYSGMGLTNILAFCGMKDERKAHNALEYAKLTAECFSRLVYGKSIFPEYVQFKIPKILRRTQ